MAATACNARGQVAHRPVAWLYPAFIVGNACLVDVNGDMGALFFWIATNWRLDSETTTSVNLVCLYACGRNNPIFWEIAVVWIKQQNRILNCCRPIYIGLKRIW